MRRPAAIQAVLAVAILAASVVPWSRTCQKVQGFPRLCATTVVWNHPVGIVASLLAAGLLAHELRSLARPAPNDGATGFLLGTLTAASLTLAVALRLTYHYRLQAAAAGTWLALSLSVPMMLAALARLQAHVRVAGLRRETRSPDAVAAPRPATLILLLAAPAAFASLFLPWVGGAEIASAFALNTGWLTFPAAVAGVLAVATVVAEIARLAGLPSLVVQVGVGAIGCSVFFALAVALIARQVRDVGGSGLAYGAWLAVGLAVPLLAAGAATLVGYAREM